MDSGLIVNAWITLISNSTPPSVYTLHDCNILMIG